MRFVDLILVSKLDTEGALDADGYPIPDETSTEVYAEMGEVKRLEFYEALRAGTRLSCVFRVRVPDYAGQTIVELADKRYKVERAYSKDGEWMELNCSELPTTKGGVTDAKS